MPPARQPARKARGAWAPALQRTVEETLRCVRGMRAVCGARILSPRHCERSEAIQSLFRGGILDCFASLAMTEYDATASLFRSISPADTPSPSRSALRPSSALHVAPSMKGRREGRAPAGTLGPSCDENAHAMHNGSTGEAGKRPAFPARCLTAYGALSPETNSCLPPSPRELTVRVARLGSAHLRKGLAVATTAGTTRFGRTHQRRSSARSLELTGFIPPCSRLSCTTLPRPPLPDPRLVTTYDRPFRRIRMADTYAETEFR